MAQQLLLKMASVGELYFILFVILLDMALWSLSECGASVACSFWRWRQLVSQSGSCGLGKSIVDRILTSENLHQSARLVSTWAADKSRVVFLMKTSPWQSVQCWIRRWGLELKHETSYTVRRVKAKERFRTGACLLPASFAGRVRRHCLLAFYLVLTS